MPAERLFGAIRIGWRFAKSSRHLQRVLIRTAAFFIGASAGMSLLPLLVRADLNGTAQQFGVLLGAVGIGAVIGAMVLSKVRQLLALNKLVASTSLLCLGIAPIGVDSEFLCLDPSDAGQWRRLDCRAVQSSGCSTNIGSQLGSGASACGIYPGLFWKHGDRWGFLGMACWSVFHLCLFILGLGSDGCWCAGGCESNVTGSGC